MNLIRDRSVKKDGHRKSRANVTVKFPEMSMYNEITSKEKKCVVIKVEENRVCKD